jgi:hypothetical protein
MFEQDMMVADGEYPPAYYPFPPQSTMPYLYQRQAFVWTPDGWALPDPNYTLRCDPTTIDAKFFSTWGNAGLDAYLTHRSSWIPDPPWVPNMGTDSVEFSEAWFPTAARVAARYGETARVHMTMDKASLIEQVILNDREVVYNGPYFGPPPAQGHAFVIYGFDHLRGVFFVKNSWGPITQLDVVPYASVTLTGLPPRSPDRHRS